MDQFRQIGEVLGSLKALMVLKHDIQINQRQCCLLLDVFTLAFETISEEISQNLRLEEKITKWKPLEHPMRELHKIFKEAELYIKNCLEIKDWWGKAISLHQNKDCVEFHIHNLLSCFPIVIEGIETASESSGLNEENTQKRRFMLMRKYDVAWNDPRLFQWKFGKQYLIPRELCIRLDNAWKEDKWSLIQTLSDRKSSKHEQRLGELLIKKLNGNSDGKVKLLPSSVLVGAKDFLVKRRLETGGTHHKEIHWLGENFALRTFFGEVEPLNDEISLVLSLSHPNVMQYLCGFYDEEKKEGFLVMELMQKNIHTYIKENSGQRKRVPFSILVAVDIMLQIARGMEYLHSRKIYHGELNPSNILVKARSSSTEGYFLAKIKGFGLTSIKSYYRGSSSQNEINPVIWYAPEVLTEQEHPFNKCSSKYTEKADVYSFAMLCFELLTGKVPFEDFNHLQGDKMVRNIRAGERPLFPHTFPKFLANLTRKCWQMNPFHRPSFSSICRILRYIKNILVVNPAHGQPLCPPPLVDYLDLESGYSNKFPEDGSFDLAPVSQIPFQLFAYRLVEKDNTISGKYKGKNWDSANEAGLMDDHDDLFPASSSRSVCSEILERKNLLLTIAADQRSVFSEAPQRKLFSVDQGSVCSESPGRKFNDSLFAETPEWRFFSRASTLPSGGRDQKGVVCYEIPEEKMSQDACESNSEGSWLVEMKTSSSKEKLVISGSEEKISDQKQVSLESSETSSLPTPKASSVRPHFSEIGKRKTQNNTTKTNQRATDYSEIAEKKVDATITSRSKKIPEKKVVLLKKLKDVKASKSSGNLIQQSPSSSPRRTPKGCSLPSSSPRWAPKGYSSPSSSPIRIPNGYSSPLASPLNPCGRCSKPNRDKLLPSIISPNRR